nr:hypothetical protein [Tanacetum cinerariifolium]
VTSVQGRLKESQAQVYHIDLEHADKVLSMQDDEPELVELKEVIEVVTIAKLMTKVVIAAATTAASTITAAPSAARRRKGVVIRAPEETVTPSTIVHSEPKSKDKGKGILVEEPKPLKKQAQIEQDEAYTRELEAELNKNINWDNVIEQVKQKGKEDNVVLRYQALKMKLQTKAHARKNMMVYLKIWLVSRWTSSKESRALKRQSKSFEQQAVKKQKLDEEVLVVDYQIHTEYNKPYYKIIRADGSHQLFLSFLNLLRNFDREDLEMLWQIAQEIFASSKPNNKPYYKIIRADGSHQLFLSFLSLLRNFDREDLEMLWQIVQERFTSSKPKNFSDYFLLTTLKAMFEKPDVEAQV